MKAPWLLAFCSTRTGQVTNTRCFSSIVDRIREAYLERETDGILELSDLVLQHDPVQLLDWTFEALETPGQQASALNGWLGACLLLGDPHGSAAATMLEAWKQHQDVSPDLVSYCLAYAASRDSAFLEQAQKYTKKQTGSKRRKQLAAAKRSKPSSAEEQLEALQNMLGDELAILKETSDYVVVNKPSGVACFHGKTTSAGKSGKDTSLVDALLQNRVPLSTLNPQAQGLVHRLDRGTSGCLLLAKTDDFHARAVSEFFVRRSRKSYTALLEAPVEGLPMEGTMETLVDGRSARSEYRVHAENPRLVTVQTKTGRKHQVRVHCASALRPIVGDWEYGSAANTGRFCLHATTLSLLDIDVEAPLPEWWKSLQA